MLQRKNSKSKIYLVRETEKKKTENEREKRLKVIIGELIKKIFRRTHMCCKR